MGLSEHAPLFAGPAALAGFWQPWFAGRGLLAGESYTGYEVMQIGAWYQAAGGSTLEDLALLAGRLLAAGVVVAALWLAVLAPGARGHAFYRLAGWYVVAIAAVLVAAGQWWDAGSLQPGTAAMTAAAWLWLAPGVTSRLRSAAMSLRPERRVIADAES